ncbi:ATP-binding cassette sub-family C member 9-like isoform X2 [Dreissena polymorpha]|uniref:ATP-binding cassette sub-family C member 9-like isoform X2 n=1 Tax=Dreissena polymorpha TaxID=45954 RepID=UPI0022653154|nr:ATP-binding cassette sub-family C member 9-like isoform X2 [Dreissena polymorpha]
MSFCGSRDGSLSVRHGVLKNKCFVDVLNIIPHAVMIVISVVIILVWRKSILGQLKAKTWVHFKCHSLRWIVTLTLTFVIALDIVEGFISDFIDPDSVNYHILIPPCISFISTVLSLVLYHNIEMWNSPRFLLMLALYWTSSCGLKLLKAFTLYQSEIQTVHLRLWTCWIQVALYASLVVIEIVVLLLQRYACYKKCRKVHPAPGLEKTRYYATYANFLSRVTFSWMNEILVEGFKAPLTIEQLGALPQEEKTVTNYKKFFNAFEVEKQLAEKKNQLPSLHRIYLRAFWPYIVLGGICRLFGDLLAFVGPWCIESIVNFAYSALNSNGTVKLPQAPSLPNATFYMIQNGDNVTVDVTETGVPHKEYFVTVTDFLNNGYALCGVLFMSTLLQHTLLQNHHYFVIREGIRLRSAVQAMVYSKALSLSSLVLTSSKTTMGQIINHMSMDANFLMMHLFFIHYIWATPLQVVICICLMYFKLGISAVLGGLLIVLSAPVQIVVGRSMSNMQKKCMQHADARVKKCNEMVQGIKVIKLLAWETFIAQGISESRKRELKAVMMNAIFKSLFTFIGTAAPILATFLTFVLYPVLENQPLTAGKALSTLALFNIMAVPLVLFSLCTSTMIMANISAKRLVPYLLAPEVEGLQGSQGHVDSIKTDADESLHGDEPEESGVLLQPMGVKDKFDALNASLCSLNSHMSPRHSRQNSSSSLGLLDLTAEHHVNPGVPRRHSAISLSVGSDHHQRRRHHSNVSIEETQYDDLPYALEITDGSFSWDLEKREPMLKNIQLKIPHGKLVMVVGTVGSGKSSLVCSMLGEMLKVAGKVTWCRNSNIALVAQKPWLLNTTLKDNILFGSPYSWKRYQKVIECCALQPDIDSLPAADGTEIGEKGVNLSGGQKQRVCIARALYSSADIIVMDDPFSALDAHVGRHVFEEVVLKKLLQRKKTVILVTHQLQYLNYAHSVVVMKEGEIECQGKLSELKRLHPEIYNNWRKALKEAKNAEAKDSETLQEDHEDLMTMRQISTTSNLSEVSSSSSSEDKLNQEANGKVLEVPMTTDAKKPADVVLDQPKSVLIEKTDEKIIEHDQSSPSGKLIKKEHREVGSVSWRVYRSYLASCGPLLVTLSLLLMVVNQALLVSTNIWVSHWASDSTMFVNNRPPNSTEGFDNSRYIHVYVTLSVCAVMVTLVSGFVFHFTGVVGAKTLHHDLLHRVMNVPMRFFDTNPSGRVINRFSSDLSNIDQKIPGTWESFLRCLFATFGAIIVNCIGTPYFIIAAVGVAFLYVLLERLYIATARELQRLDSVTKSPVFSHFSETLSGLQTIRAYKAQSRFQQTAITSIDTNVLPFLFNQTANRWLGVRLDYFGAILVLVSAVTSLLAGLAGKIDPAYVGLCIAYALMVSNYLNWIVRNKSELEMMMNAVERVEEYKKLDIETTPAADSSTKVSGWPSEGSIEFCDVSLRYDTNQDPVVHGVSFKIEPGEKVGICGRTGSGKSSLTLSMFRMLDISSGEILIDGRNICHVALPELRSKLAIIPQDPILFTGTIRYNLDPTSEIEDSKLWMALESVQLRDTIEALPEKLDAHVSEGGENFSIGQKQLFCLARAFLRENKVLVLDEATASIDLETDNKLQKVIGTVFKDRTVITIAHRISTIMKYDRVMTMEHGQLKEFDTPSRLLKDEDSLFARLVKHSYK